MMNLIPISAEKAQKELDTLLRDIAQSTDHYILTANEQPLGALMSLSEYNKLICQTQWKKAQYLRTRIEEGIGSDELKSLLEQMDRIDQAFESGQFDTLIKEADASIEEKAKAWCAKHGLTYDPTDDAAAAKSKSLPPKTFTL